MTGEGNLAAFYISAVSNGINPLLYGWSSIIAARGGDDAARGLILAGMVAIDMLLYTFWGIALYSAGQAPYWRNGYIANTCVTLVLAGWMFLMRWVGFSLTIALLFASIDGTKGFVHSLIRRLLRSRLSGRLIWLWKNLVKFSSL